MADHTVQVDQRSGLSRNELMQSRTVGKIAVARIELLDDDGVSSGHFIADLRQYTGDSSFDTYFFDNPDTPDDIEEADAWIAIRRNLRPIDAMIAPSDDPSSPDLYLGDDRFRRLLYDLARTVDRIESLDIEATTSPAVLTPDKTGEVRPPATWSGAHTSIREQHE